MLSPAVTVVISLLLVAAIGYLIGSATGKRTASRTPTAMLRRLQAERDQLGTQLKVAETDRDALRSQIELGAAEGDSGSASESEELQRRDEALAELQVRVHSSEDEIEALRSENSALEHRLADRQTALEITTSDREVHAGRLQEITRELETLRRQAAEGSPAADAGAADSGALNRDLDRLRDQLNNQGGQLRVALQNLATRDDELGRLRTKLEDERARIERSPDPDEGKPPIGLAASDDRTRAVSMELEEARAVIADLEARHADEVSWRDERIAELETDRSASDVEIWLEEARAALAQSEEQRAQLAPARRSDRTAGDDCG